MCLKIISKVKKKQQQGFTLSLGDTFFEKPQGRVKLTPPLPPSLFRRFRVNSQICLSTNTVNDITLMNKKTEMVKLTLVLEILQRECGIDPVTTFFGSEAG